MHPLFTSTHPPPTSAATHANEPLADRTGLLLPSPQDCQEEGEGQGGRSMSMERNQGLRVDGSPLWSSAMITEEQSYYYQLHRSGFLQPLPRSPLPQGEGGTRDRRRLVGLDSSLLQGHSISLTGIGVHQGHHLQHQNQSELHLHYSQELGMQQLRQAVGMGLGHPNNSNGVGLGHHSNGVGVEPRTSQREEQEEGAYFRYTTTTTTSTGTDNGYLPPYYPNPNNPMVEATSPTKGAEDHLHYRHLHPHRHLPVLRTALSISEEEEQMFLGSGSGMGLVAFHLRQPHQQHQMGGNTSFEDTHSTTSNSSSTNTSMLNASLRGVGVGNSGLGEHEGEEEGTGMNGTALHQPRLNTNTSMEDSSLMGKFERERLGREEGEVLG